MPGPSWDTDAPADLPRIGTNAEALMAEIMASAGKRLMPDLDDARAWHRRLYADCAVPVRGYLGHFRGEPAVRELVGYEVGIGRRQRDGYPEKVGVWSAELAAALPLFIERVHSGLKRLDAVIAPGDRPATEDGVQAVVALCAAVHGEWIRLHPFANGNGRTARVWANFVAVRYGLPPFVRVKPRPDVFSYALAAHESMGRPPEFTGDHASMSFVFAKMLRECLES